MLYDLGRLASPGAARIYNPSVRWRIAGGLVAVAVTVAVYLALSAASDTSVQTWVTTEN